KGEVIREAGYDGEYGVIRLFEERELKRLTAGDVLFDAPIMRKKKNAAAKPMPPKEAAAATMPARPVPARPEPARPAPGDPVRSGAGLLGALDDDQRAAAAIVDGPLMIVAGPGSGKTRTLTHRIAHLVAERGVAPAHCLAITFTRRAAAELRERLGALLGGAADAIAIHTFHSLGLAILREHPAAAGLHRGFHIADKAERLALLAGTMAVTPHKAETLLRAISKAKRNGCAASRDVADAMAAYRQAMQMRDAVDFDDLIGLAIEALTADAGLVAHYRER